MRDYGFRPRPSHNYRLHFHAIVPLLGIWLVLLPAAFGLTEFEGLAFGPNEFERTWRRSGNCNIVSRPSTARGTFTESTMDFSDIPSSFSCDPHRFRRGSASITHEPNTLKVFLDDDGAVPRFVTTSPGLAVVGSISGTAEFVQGGDSHRVRVLVRAGIGAASSCSDEDTFRTGREDAQGISASAQCDANELEVVSASIVTEEVDGVAIVAEFVALLTTEISILMDHGNTGTLGISNGAEYKLIVRSRYKFELSGQSDREQDLPPPNPYRPLPPTDTNFVSESGGDLDTGCTFRENGPLRIEVPIVRVAGQVINDGELAEPEKLIRNGFVTPTATLRLAVWDIDSNPPDASGNKPEFDRIQLNGEDLGDVLVSQGFLEGGDKRWKVNQFEVPIEFLRFGRVNSAILNGNQSPPTPGLNVITIDIDQQSPANEDGVWCTSVDWASLSFGAIAPLALVHGTNAQQSTWELAIRGPSPVEHLTGLGVPFEHRINLLANGSPDDNAIRLLNRLIQIAESFGTDSLHLVTHSKGATDSRRMLHAYYWEGVPIRILSMFSIGTPSKGTVLSSAGVVAADGARLNQARELIDDPDVRSALLDAYLGNWAGLAGLAPVDPARAAQTPEAMRAFNERTPKHPSVPYYSIAGSADANGNDLIEFAEADGMFPSFAPEALQSLFGTRIHRFLGRAVSLEMIIEPAGLIGTLLNVTPLSALINYKIEATTVLRDEPAPNDLVSTAASTHCAECRFAALQTYPNNHSALKRPRTIDLILNQIRALYPIGVGGRTR